MRLFPYSWVLLPEESLRLEGEPQLPGGFFPRLFSSMVFYGEVPAVIVLSPEIPGSHSRLEAFRRLG